MIPTFSATIYTANIRDVDGCDSDNAIDAIYAAAETAARRYAEESDIVLTIDQHYPTHERRGGTVNVTHTAWGSDVDPETQIEAQRQADEIEEYLDRAIDQAIEAGDWED